MVGEFEVVNVFQAREEGVVEFVAIVVEGTDLAIDVEILDTSLTTATAICSETSPFLYAKCSQGQEEVENRHLSNLLYKGLKYTNLNMASVKSIKYFF